MKTLVLILLLSIPSILFSQDGYIEIPAKDSLTLKQYKIYWHTGIDPVKTKDGRWVLPERCAYIVPPEIKVEFSEKEEPADLRIYLLSKDVIMLKAEDFIEPEEIVIKEVDVKLIK